MNEQNPSAAIQDIKRMMERSSRFISLSGLSGVSAGICALIGAVTAYPYIYEGKNFYINRDVEFRKMLYGDITRIFNTYLFWIACATFCAAFISAFFFTWLKSRKDNVPIWNSSARRLMVSVAVPLIAGAVYIIHLFLYPINMLFIAPGCLIFYGLALVNASRYTLQEIKYLGYCQLALGFLNLWYQEYGLYFWAFGFGVLHIVYGIYMWMKYERKTEQIND